MDANDNDRRLRVQYPGALYHMTSRGVGRNLIYLDDYDRQIFFSRMEQTVGKFGWLVYAITLMSNHFHLYFRTPQPNLSAGAQYLLGTYARQFNRHHGRSGHLFEGRFRCQVIEDERYAWTVSRYVHLNPVPVLVDHPADWPWSSYAGYCDPTRRLPWVCYDELLGAWSGGVGGAAEAYQEFVVSGGKSPKRSPFRKAIDGWILGSAEFAERIRRLVSPASQEPDAVQSRLPAGVPLSTIVNAVCAEFGVSPCELRRTGNRHPARSIVAHLGRQASRATLREIASELGLARRDCVARLSQKARLAAPGTPLHRQLSAIERRLREA